MHRAVFPRPGPSDYPSFYTTYIQRVPEGDILQTLERQIGETRALVNGIPDARADHRYGLDKWSIREVVGHMGDVERVMGYRALRFSRNDPTPLPGFDENLYVRSAAFGQIALRDLAEELALVRQANLRLFRGMTEEMAGRRGVANEAEVPVRAFPFILAGHELHHVAILKERYL